MSIRFQADNDLKFAIVKAVRQQEPAIDFASAQQAGLDGLSDPEVLELAAAEGRVLISHDRRTLLKHFRNHLAAGKTSSGLLVVSQGAPVGVVAEAIVILWAAAKSKDLNKSGVPSALVDPSQLPAVNAISTAIPLTQIPLERR